MKNILVADDHAFIRRVAMESLTALDNVIVTEVENGTDALHALGLQSTERLPADNAIPNRAFMNISPRNLTCLVTDFNMPHANGLQILRLIRMGLSGVPRDFPVVMLTGFNEDRMVAAAIQLDVNAFVIKPVAKPALQDRPQTPYRTARYRPLRPRRNPSKPDRTRTTDTPREYGNIQSGPYGSARPIAPR